MIVKMNEVADLGRAFQRRITRRTIRWVGERFIVETISSMCEELLIDVEETRASWMFSEMNCTYVSLSGNEANEILKSNSWMILHPTFFNNH